MRIGVISAAFPPNILGGAEISASNLAAELSSRGHEVSVLTAFAHSEPGLRQRKLGNINVYEASMPRSYQLTEYVGRGKIERYFWHIQDHLDPRNKMVWREFLDASRPDVIMMHVVQGLGFNGVSVLAESKIPCVVVLHDLSWLCIKTSMFNNGVDCNKLCSACNLSSNIKSQILSKVNLKAIVSPSRANLETFKKFSDIRGVSSFVIPNANRYPKARVGIARSSGRPQLLYVGQISSQKGVPFLLEVLSNIKPQVDFRISIFGTGPEHSRLAAMYAGCDWVSFGGHVSQEDVSDAMAQADLLLVPSLWRENYPGVVVQALQTGLPVLASNAGGIPELVEDGVSGLLEPPGDSARWRAAIASVLKDQPRLMHLRRGATKRAIEFNIDEVVSRYEAILRDLNVSRLLTE